MRRRPRAWAALAAWLTIPASVVVNYASDFTLPGSENPWLVWPVLAVLATVLFLRPSLTCRFVVVRTNWRGWPSCFAGRVTGSR